MEVAIVAGDIQDDLERERKKLVQLVDEALKCRNRIIQSDTILEQSRKVDALLEQVQEKRICTHIQRQ
jgi:hypothetical protein